ncbi:MAG TPA: hypothetical protein VF937_08535, partial [Chloroflexota bacterium]
MHRPLSRVVRITAGGLTLERLTFGTLAALAVSLGLGDIAQVTPAATLLVNGVHALLPAAIGLALIGAIRRRRHRHGPPSFPRPVFASIGVWLVVLLASAALAPSHRAEALGTLERPVMGVLLAWVVCDVCRSAARWRRLLHAMTLGGLAIGVIALAEATG